MASAVLDLQMSKKSGLSITKNFVLRVYKPIIDEFGPITLYPWNGQKPHIYAEFPSPEACGAAQKLQIPELVASPIARDLVHLSRLMSLKSAKSKTNHRYSPYDAVNGGLSAGISRASLLATPMQIDPSLQGDTSKGCVSSRHGLSAAPFSLESLFLPFSPAYSHQHGQWPENLGTGLQSVMSTTDARHLASLMAESRTPSLPASEHAVGREEGELIDDVMTLRRESASSSASSGYMSASSQVIHEAVPLPRPKPSGPNANQTIASTSRSQPPTEKDATDMLQVLSNIRQQKKQEAAISGTRPTQSHRINARFDFQHHIQNGGLRNHDGDPQASGTDLPVYKLTPLQAYFADVYGSLQTELVQNKRQQKALKLELEKQRILREQSKEDAAEERRARRLAEQAQAKYHQRTWDVQIELENAREELGQANEELLKERRAKDELANALVVLRNLASDPNTAYYSPQELISMMIGLCRSVPLPY